MDERGTVSPPSEPPVVIPDGLSVRESDRTDDPDRRADPFDPRILHRVELIERGPFSVAVCSGCRWESFARRSRPLARSEGRDHELLHRV